MGATGTRVLHGAAIRAGATGAAGIVAVATLVACSSGGGTTSSSASAGGSPRASASASASASATGSGATSAAAQQYVSLTAAAEADLTGFLAQPNTAPVAQVQAAAAKVAQDYPTLLQGLQQASWPSAAQAPIATLEAAIPAEQAVYQQCATQPSIAAIKAVLQQDQAVILKRATAAREVRTVLGLPESSPSGSAQASTSATGSATA